MNTAIIYLYKEGEYTKKNLQFFLDHGITDDNDFYILVNNHECSVNIPHADNIKVIKKDDQLDFPSYWWLLNNEDLEQYDNLIFLNASCIGPFLPRYCNNNWIYYIEQILRNYDFIGPVIEFPASEDNISVKWFNGETIPFIHTYMFAMNKSCFPVFIQSLNDLKTKYPGCTEKTSCIILERELANLFIQKGLKIYSFLLICDSADINDRTNWHSDLWHESKNITCFEVPKNYHGIDLNPLEIMFIKNIRNEHEHRGKDRSGISNELKTTLYNYTNWMNGRTI